MAAEDTFRVLYLLGPETVELRRQTIPRPAVGEVVLRIDRATTCGTDLKVFLRGGHPTMITAPAPFGHEMAGTIVACGKGVAEWQEADQVVVANSAACGVCELCVAGRHNLCTDLHYLNGAFAERLLVPARFVERSLYRRPAVIPAAVAALAEPLACVLHGLEACTPRELDEVVVIGAGPIGQLFVIELVHRGCRVILADLEETRLEVGRDLGAAACVRLRSGADSVSRIVALCGGAANPTLVIEATGVPEAWGTAMEVVGRGGSVVLFGGCAPGTRVDCDTHRLHYSEISVRGAFHHTPATFATALARLTEDPASFGRLIEEEHPLEGVAGALRRMQERKILKAAIAPCLDMALDHP